MTHIYIQKQVLQGPKRRISVEHLASYMVKFHSYQQF